MNREVIITCALTGAGETVGKHPAIPVTPEAIADSALEAAKAGAAIVHVHVRDVKTGAAVEVAWEDAVQDGVMSFATGRGASYTVSLSQ